MDPREMVRLGHSGVSVSRLGLGLAPLIGHSGNVDDRTVDAIIRQARLLGIRHIDVAPLYGRGRSEAAIERCVTRVGGDTIAISTKAGARLATRNLRNRIMVRTLEMRYTDDRRRMLADYRRFAMHRLAGRRDSRPTGSSLRSPTERSGPGGRPSSVERPDMVVIRDFSERGVRRSAMESLDRLGRQRVEIMFLHDPDGLRGQSIRHAWKPLVDLRERGIVGAIGFSGNASAPMARMLETLDADVVLLAGRYTLLDQSAFDDLLPLAQQRGVAVILGGVFNGGLIADPDTNDQFDYRPAGTEHRRRAAQIASLGTRFGVPAAAAAIQFAAAHPAVASVIIGVRSPTELVDDVRLAELPIPEAYWDEVISAGILRPDVPIPADPTLLEEDAG